jgi:glycosyl transferase family 25
MQPCAGAEPERVLPILYINLERDRVRRSRMHAQFQRLGLQAVRLPGTLWTGLPETRQQELYSGALNRRLYFAPLVTNEKGCYASHIDAWRWLLDSTHRAAVILEDDVVLAEDFARVIGAIEALDASWDMIKLFGRDDGPARWKVRRECPLTEGYTLTRFRRVPCLASGYVLSRDAAARLLSRCVPFGRPVDMDFRHWWETGVRVQGLLPGLVTLDETSAMSSIGERGSVPGLVAKWRRLRYLLGYNFTNFWHYSMARGRPTRRPLEVTCAAAGRRQRRPAARSS